MRIAAPEAFAHARASDAADHRHPSNSLPRDEELLRGTGEAGPTAPAVFGAPQELDDAPGRALAAGREMAERLARAVEGVEAGIGISFGEVVAGNVGGAKRFEYTVIGDAVNEAAGLMEPAKEDGSRLLASSRAVEASSEEEAGHWQLTEEVKLRGRSQVTRLARPCD